MTLTASGGAVIGVSSDAEVAEKRAATTAAAPVSASVRRRLQAV
jgi:hypothetical protein